MSNKIIGITVGTTLNPDKYGGVNGDNGSNSGENGISTRQEMVIDTPAWEEQPSAVYTFEMRKAQMDADKSQGAGGPGEVFVRYPFKEGDMVYWTGAAEPTLDDLNEFLSVASYDEGSCTVSNGTVYNLTSTGVNFSTPVSAKELKTLFHSWEEGNYFTTRAGADGTTLPSNQFRLKETLDGLPTVDCVFTVDSIIRNGANVTANYPVDFIESDGKLMMRDAGVVEFSMDFTDKLTQKYQLLYNGKTINNSTTGVKYVYLRDDYMSAQGGKVVVRVSVGKYNGYNGVMNFVSTHLNNGVKLAGFKINAERTKRGYVGQWLFLADGNNSQHALPWFTDTTAATEDFTAIELNTLKITSNKQIYYANGSHIILEEYVMGEGGKAGTSVTDSGKGIESANINSDGDLIIGYTDGSTASVGKVRGEKGDPGYTPQKGADYWTAEERAEMVTEVIDSVKIVYPEAHIIHGDVDADNTITLNGELADGTYILKYEGGDGEIIEIGTLEVGGSSEYTNILPLSIDSSGNAYNGEQGWKTGYRLNSTGTETDGVDMEITGFIPVKHGDIVRLKNIDWTASASQTYVWCYDSNFNPIAYINAAEASLIQSGYAIFDRSNNLTQFTASNNFFVVAKEGGGSEVNGKIAYFRLSCIKISADSIITINQTIV